MFKRFAEFVKKTGKPLQRHVHVARGDLIIANSIEKCMRRFIDAMGWFAPVHSSARGLLAAC